MRRYLSRSISFIGEETIAKVESGDAMLEGMITCDTLLPPDASWRSGKARKGQFYFEDTFLPAEDSALFARPAR